MILSLGRTFIWNVDGILFFIDVVTMNVLCVHVRCVNIPRASAHRAQTYIDERRRRLRGAEFFVNLLNVTSLTSLVPGTSYLVKAV